MRLQEKLVKELRKIRSSISYVDARVRAEENKIGGREKDVYLSAYLRLYGHINHLLETLEDFELSGLERRHYFKKKRK